tara:strand:- start:266 stop:1249 length:984 start_codon:yes stop_codon:yes gene_type:complete
VILKVYELQKVNLLKNNFILLFGDNQGAKNETILKLISKFEKDEIISYEESQILNESEIFFNNIYSKSLFNNRKIIIITRATNKILSILENILEKDFDDISIIINAPSLDRKSKLRSRFEKSTKLFCIAFYPDTNEILSKLAQNYLRKSNVTISQANVNLIVNKCNGDRSILNNELDKIVNFNLTNKKMTTENLLKLINLAENYSIAELIDNCLAKNYKKTNYILNENNFTSDDCVAITRTIINKSKKLLILSKEFEVNKNLDQTISNSKPPIFWKDKEIVKKQLIKWKSNEIKELIYELLAIELQVKKNNASSLYIISNFILEKSL